MMDEDHRYHSNRKLAAQVYVQAADKVGSDVPERVRQYANEAIPSKFTGMTQPQAEEHLTHLKELNKRYETLNDKLAEMLRDTLKDRIARGEEVSPERLRQARTTRHDLEMEIKLDKIREDPEKYYQEARKKAYKDIVREDREVFLRPFKKALDWILRRR